MKSDVARYCHSLGRIVRARFRRNECQRTSRIFFVRGCASLSLLARLETLTGGHARSLSHARGPLSTRARCNVDFFFFLFPSYTCGTSLRILVCRDMSANFFLLLPPVFFDVPLLGRRYLLRDCFPLRRL